MQANNLIKKPSILIKDPYFKLNISNKIQIQSYYEKSNTYVTMIN